MRFNLFLTAVLSIVAWNKVSPVQAMEVDGSDKKISSKQPSVSSLNEGISVTDWVTYNDLVMSHVIKYLPPRDCLSLRKTCQIFREQIDRSTTSITIFYRKDKKLNHLKRLLIATPRLQEAKIVHDAEYDFNQAISVYTALPSIEDEEKGRHSLSKRIRNSLNYIFCQKPSAMDRLSIEKKMVHLFSEKFKASPNFKIKLEFRKGTEKFSYFTSVRSDIDGEYHSKAVYSKWDGSKWIEVYKTVEDVCPTRWDWGSFP